MTFWLSHPRLACAPVLALCLLVFSCTPGIMPVQARAAPLTPLYFDDSSPDRIILGNTAYEFQFRKSNGSIAAIISKPHSQSITLGSRWECLWGAVLTGPEEFTGGCHFGAGSTDRFSYEWLPATSTLHLKYEPDATGGPYASAQVEVRLTNEAWLDMRLHIQNRSGRPIERVLFPCDLSFAEGDIQEAVLPILPGVALQPSFWAENRSYIRKYPGWPGLFADLVSLETVQGYLSIYSLPDEEGNLVDPTYLGFQHDEEYAKDSTYYHHTFGAWIPVSGSWSTPWVRLLVGFPWQSSVPLLREHLGIAALPSLQEKLGTPLAELPKLPLYKADTVQLGLRFNEYALLLDRIPYPGLLHPVAWQPGGHDENYPDYLPPDPKWGTTADMAAMFREAQARGFLVMPYSNPTWWDDESPTLTNLPAGVSISDVALIDRDGKPLQQSYGSHNGYVVSPWSPFVIARVAQLVEDMKALGADVQFWDQAGAREWEYDFNKYEPNPLAYMDGWLQLAETHKTAPLMTEMGYKDLAGPMLGFHGSVLLVERQGQVDPGWHEGLWRPVPLASALLGDKALLYQHDLAPETFTHDKATLAWNLAMGYMLSYDLAPGSGGVDGEWLAAVGALQRFALARIAGHPATGFELQPGPVYEPRPTRTRYGDCWTLVNWDAANTRVWGTAILPPSGSQIYCPDDGSGAGELTAGVFEVFRGYSLAAGDHVIIEERKKDVTVVRHPLGSATIILASYPLTARIGAQYAAEAIGYDGKILGTTPVVKNVEGLKFLYASVVGGEPVEQYRLRELPLLFLPLIRK